MQRARISSELFQMALNVFGLREDELDPDVGILELGLDSLMIIKLGQEIERRWAVPLETAWFLSAMPSLTSLADHILARAPAMAETATTAPVAAQPSPFPPRAAAPEIAAEGTDAGLALCIAQMQALQDLFGQQLAALSQGAQTAAENRRPPSSPTAGTAAPSTGPASAARPHMRGFVLEQAPLSPEQAAFVANLLARHRTRTPRSRELGRKSPVLADWKTTLSYRPELKDIAYPIVADRMAGGRFCDVDGNDYIDIAVGMGVHFLGHNPPYVAAALRRRLDRGFGLGPQCDLTEKAAESISRLTGMERVSFCNTGSEAVMFALRIARAKSGKRLVALFAGSYHGTFDGVLAAAEAGGTAPSSPGTLPGMVEDILILDYNAESAFARLEAESDRLAAVLVEPVQSRRPGLQPQTFLRRLRRFTAERGICLIFDEMVNGFRIAPGGSQEHFGIRADMALYGKVAGGGMPVGIVAGRKDYLDYIDGGFLGEDSLLPSEETIVFGGTFCRHPLSMEAVVAVTDHLLEHGPGLCARATALTGEMADDLNLWFQDHEVPLRLMHYGAQFIFESYGPYSAFAQPIELTLFYLLLQHSGVYTWERRTCGLGVDHGPDEIAAIAQAVKDSVLALRAGGFSFRLPHGAPAFFAPMTDVQERLFAIFQRPHGQDAYHLPLAWRIDGPIDAELLEIALGEVIRRHDALRTAFIQRDGRLLQKIVPEPVFFLERSDEDANRDKSDAEQIRSFIRPFALECPPLLRAHLAAQPDGSHLFLLDVLHIAADGASLGLILEEINALMKGGSPETRPVSFREAILSLPEENREQDRLHWVARLADLPPLEWPFDAAAQAGSPLGRQSWTTIEADALDRAKTACKRYGLTLNMFLNGVYVLFLNTLTNGRRFCVGMADGGRFSPKAENAVGMFVNTVPQLFGIDPEAPLTDFFTKIRQACAESIAHNRAPYGDIVAALGFSPAVTMLSYEKADQRRLDWPGIAARPLPAHGQGAMYDFAIDIVEMDGVLHLNLIHSDAFSPESASSFGQVFRQLLIEAALRPEARIRDLDPMPAEQKADRLREWSDSRHPLPQERTLLDALNETRSDPAQGRASALVQNRGGDVLRLTYAEMHRRSDALARQLIRLGAGADKVVALLLPRGPDFAVAALAVWKAGAAYLPLSPDYPEDRIRFMLEDSGAMALIGADGKPPAWAGFGGAVLDMRRIDDGGEDGNGDLARSAPKPSDLAYILYTSGTTGQPKGVMIEHRGLYNLCRWFIRHYGVGPKDRCSAFAPFVFDASVWELFPMLMQGAEIHILSEEVRHSLPGLQAYLRDHRITVSYFLSQVAEMIDGAVLPDLRLMLSGGDVLHIASARGHYRHCNTYGPTEFTVTSHSFDLDGSWPVPIGRPADNCQSLILDAYGRLMPDGFPGELCLAGAQIARGYRNRPDLTAAAFAPNPFASLVPPSGGIDYARMYRTGDLCRRRKDGVYLFLGRRDGQVKIRGHRVEPAEIAHRAMEHPGLAQAIVRAINDGTGQKRLCLYAVPAAGIDPVRLEEGLRGHLGQVLPFYMLPADYVFLKEMPQGLSGKIDLRALPLPESKSAPFVPPKGAAEETLAGLWRAQFNRPRIGRDDNFFELGGDSIAALMLSAGLKAKGYALRARDIFDAPILHALAARLEPITPHGAAKAPLPIPQTPAPDDAALKARFGDALRHSAPPLPIQLGMLVQQKLHQDRDMYVEQSLLAIDGPLDADALKARFFRLVDRHESLRSVLVETGLTAPRLAVLDAVPEDAFTILDLSRDGLTDEAVTEKLDEDAVKERLALADVARPPLMRLRLYRLSERRFRLLVSVHHLIFDGWSGGVFFSELFAETEPEGPALPFRAVIAHRAQQDDGAAKRFWRGYLDGIEERTGIPGLVQIPDAPFQDARHPLNPPPEMRQRLIRLAETTRTTVNLLLEAAWAVVLSRANRSSDILFGRVVSGRPQELDGMAGIIGPCINTVPVRARCQPERCFTDLVCQMRDDALAAEAHVWLPLTDIQAQSPLRTDLFGHFFVMESYPAPRARNGLHIAEIGEFSRTGFDVAIAWEMRDSFLAGSLIYNAAALPGWQAESLGAAYLDLLDAVLADPERPLAAYPLLSPSTQARLLRDQAPERITVTDDDVTQRIADRAARQPDAIALICGEDRLSYAELDAASTRLAARLYAHRPDADRDPARPPVVAVLLDRSADFTLSLLAILKAGAVFLPLDPDIPAERLAFCLTEAAPFAVLTQRRHAARIPAAIPCLMTDDAAPTPPAAGFAPIANAPDDPAYLIYTSGTTGTPKGVLVSHRALTNQTLWSRRRYAIGPHSQITHFAAHAFDVSLWEVLPCLVGGGTLHVLTDALRHNPEKLHAYVAAQGITDLWLPPHLAALYLESYSVAGLSSLTAGGDVFTPRTIKDPGPDFHLFNNYGPTECAVTATSHKFRPGDCVTIGQPVDNTPCYVLDGNGHLQPLGFPGELCIGGPQLAIGYLNDAARTAEKFVADPFDPTPGARMYRTGDECRFLPGGQIAILGRLDQQVKIRGYRLELGEVEKALLRSPLLSRCVAAPRMDGSTGVLRLLAWAIPAAGAPQDGLARAALAEAAHWLPAYMMPDALILVDGFPLSVSGKIRTADLPDPPREQDKARARRSPETPEQIGLARTIQEVLGIAGIGLDDDFFALGGDSIKALALIASLERQGFSITLSDVFRHPVIEDLARQFQLQSPTPPSATIHPRTPAIPAKDERILVKRYARQGVEHVLPLTPMQAGMLFDMRHGEAANRHAYWIENRAELQGPLSADAVETRLYELTARHEALRLVIAEDGLSAPAQAVLRHKDAAFAATDLSDLTADEQDAAIARACAETRADPPCLDQDPLLRVLLFRRGPDSHAMALFWHHIALDGWSLSLLLGELFAPELPLEPAPGFSRHLHRLAARHPAAKLEWWQEKLAGGPAAAVIAAAETPAPAARDASLDFVSRTLDRHSDARLRTFARQRRCTPASVLMTAWGLLLSRYNDAEDVVFAFLSSGREPAEADIVGPCITLAPLRLSRPYDATFSQLVGETHDGLAQALAHDGCPAADLRRLAGAGFGDALFVMENQPPIETDGPLTVVPGGGFGANGVGVAAEWRDDGRLRLILHYDPARYGRRQMEALAEHHLILLEDALARPETPSGALDLIGPAERLRLLKSCNDTKREWPETSTVDLFLAAAARHPDRPALEGTDAAYSYASLRDTAATIAARLREQGVRPGVPVGILLPRSADYVLAELAVMLAGGAFVPLNPDDPPSRLATMLAQCGAAGVILEPGSSGHPCLDGENAPAGFPLDRLKTPLAPDAARELSPPSPHDPAYILYTSGSTGTPKGVVIAQRGLANLCRWFAEDHHTGPDDAFSLYAPFIFDASVYEAFPALACGASLHVVPEEIRLEEEELADFFRDRAISVAFLPPIVGKSLLAGRRFPHLRIVTFAGDRPGALTPQPFTLMNCYGPTEFTVCATFWPVTKASEAPPIGAPIANAHAHLLDSRGRLMPFGAAGELCLSGVPLALGYANLPDRTAAAFVPNPFAAGDPDYALMYRSGDLCRRAFDGTLEFLGRLDRQIKLRGRRLEPEEIEQALRRHPAVDEAVVLPVRQGTADILRAFVTVTPGPVPNAALLLDGLAGSLPDWMIPGDIRILPSLPLTTNGKIDRDALAALEPDEPEHKNGASPLGEGPALLARLWGETLGQDAGGDRSFFALGGDSIKAMHLVSRLRAQGWRLTTRQIFSLQTLDRLSAVLEPVETGPHRAAEPESILPSLPTPDDSERKLIQARLDGMGRIEAIFPPTPMQENLLAYRALNPSSPAYLEQSRLIVQGPLTAEQVRDRLENAARRHAALRSVFVQTGARRPWLVVLGDHFPAFSQTDLSHLPPKDQDAALDAALRAVRDAGMDPEQGPLLRLDLCRLGPDRHALLVSFHHIILDGWSMGLLLREILAPIAPKTPAPDFSAYAAWLAGTGRQEADAWWRHYLDGAAPSALCPAARTNGRAYDNRALSAILDETLCDGLRHLAAETGVTMNSLIQTGWAIVLARHDDREDALFGTVLSGRAAPVPGIEEMVGLLVRTVPVRVSCPDSASVRSVLKIVQDNATLLEDRSVLPLTDILKATPHGADLIRTLFVFENLPEADMPDGYAVSAAPGFNQTPYALTLVVESQDRRLCTKLNYDAAVLDDSRAAALLDRLAHVLARMAAAPDAPLGAIGLLDERGEDAILAAALADPVRPILPDEPQDVVALFRRAALANPDACALAANDARLSYETVRRSAHALAQNLAERGIGPGAVVAIMLERSAETIIAMLGVLEAGAAYMIIDPGLPPFRRDFLLKDCAAALLLATAAEPDKGCGIPVLSADAAFVRAPDAPDLPLPDADPGRAAYLVYTSGSTGEPKGVLVEHGALANFCHWHREFYGVTGQDVMGHVFAFAFDASAWGIFPILAAGGCIHILLGEDRTRPERMRDYFDAHGVTLANIPALFMERMQALPAPRALRLLTSGGDAPRAFTPQPYAVFNEYGPSEATVMCTCHPPQPGEFPIPIGRAIAGAWCLVLDRGGRLQPFGVSGELHIAGPLLAQGYWRRPGEAKKSFIPNPFAARLPDRASDPGAYARLYRTGDLCRMRPDGVLEFLGRRDTQLSVRGHRVEASEVEQALLALDGIVSATVMLCESPGGSVLTAYVVPQALPAGQPGDAIARWREALARNLPAYMRPDAFVLLDALPLTANGKLDRAALPAPDFLTGSGRGGPARKPVELALAGLWREILPGTMPGLDDDFFAQGGDSVSAARLVAGIETLYGLRLSMADFLRGASLRSLAALVGEKTGGKGAESLLVPLRSGRGPALVLVPSLGNSLLCYKGIVDSLPADMPLYALSPLDWETTRPATLAEAVAPYSAPLRKAFPDGAFTLLGLCMAGLTAWEIARQMEQTGAGPRGVISLNTRRRLLEDDHGQALDLPDEVPDDAITIGLDAMAGYEGPDASDPDPSHRARLAALIRVQLGLWGRYRPEPGPWTMLCLRPEEPALADYLPFETRPLGWETLAQNGAREIYVPGSHFTMLSPPHAAHLAGMIRTHLRGPAVLRTLPLTPIQRWFVALPMERGHFFQSVALRMTKRRPAGHYQQILVRLAESHDMLHAFCPDDGQDAAPATLSLAGKDEARFCFGLHIAKAQDLEETQQRIASAQRIDRPPLAWCLLGQGEGDEPDRLVFMIHHLSIDGVSWRILLADFAAALDALDRGQPITLPSLALRGDNTSAAWAERLVAHATGPDLAREAAFWAAQPRTPPLVPEECRVAPRLKRDMKTYEAVLPPRISAALQSQSHARFAAGVDEVLLAAFLDSLRASTGRRECTMRMEGHGREELFTDVSPLALVGWFTSLYPLPLTGAENFAATVAAVRDRKAALPEQGIGYGLLRYLGKRTDLDRAADLTFNFLGDAALPMAETAPFRLDRLGSPYDVGDDFPEETPLSLTAYVQDGKLHLALAGHPQEWNDGDLERLLDGMTRCLETVFDH